MRAAIKSSREKGKQRLRDAQPDRGNAEYTEKRPLEITSEKAAHEGLATPPTYKVTPTSEIIFKRTSVTLDQKFVDWFFTLEKLEYERPYNDFMIQSLQQEMIEGTMLWEDVKIKTADLKGTIYRINGKHTCLAVKNLNTDPDHVGYSSPEKAVFHEHYLCNTSEEMRMLWSKVDAGAARTQGNQVIAQLKGVAGLSHLTDRTLKQLAEGFGWFFWSGEDRKNHRAAHRAHLLKGEWKPIAIIIGDFLQQQKSKEIRHITKQPVIGAMFATARVQLEGKHGFYEFWNAIRDNIHMDSKKDARWQLYRYLSTFGMGVARNRKPDSSEVVYKKCLNAWNNFRSGTEISQLVATKDRPKAI